MAFTNSIIQNMAKNKQIEEIRLSDFPEEMDKQHGVKIYGETSYENMLAVLSQYLHHGAISHNIDRKEIISAILEFLERKKSQHPELDCELSEEYAAMVAENPNQYNLFDDFFNNDFFGRDFRAEASAI